MKKKILNFHRSDRIADGKHAGFTLIELSLSILLSGIITTAVYSAYVVQQRTYHNQEAVAAVQQNLRAALDLVTYDLRMAGLDPYGTAGAEIKVALPGQIQFTADHTGGECDSRDNDGDGNTDETDEEEYSDGGITLENGHAACVAPGDNEYFTFGFDPAGDDANTDGVPDVSGAVALRKQIGSGATAGGFQTIAENIDRIEFAYVLEDGSLNTTPGNLNDIQGVQFSILARADRADPNFTNAATYTTPVGTVWGPFGDNFRRRFVTMTIQLRNLGL